MKARWFQDESSTAAAVCLLNPKCHPLVAIPTGAGKTLAISMTIDKYLTDRPKAKILVLSHVQEILEQNYESLSSYFDFLDIGLYSAGLGSRSIGKITVAGIQSAYRNPDLFKDVDVIIIDEAHRVPFDDNTMYRKFIKEVGAQVLGFTATPFRAKGGYLHKGVDAIFNHLAYDITDMDSYNRLIEEGFLSPIYPKETALRLDAEEEGIRTTAGDYNQKDLSLAFDRSSITKAAIRETVEFFNESNRKLALYFAIDIAHAEHIADELRGYGRRVVCIHSKMDLDRKVEIKKIKNMEYDDVVNVDVLTTGFDAPQIDMIADMQPTKSPVKHVQKWGRGGRIHPNKKYCAGLDFAGNVDLLGPINDVRVNEAKKGKGAGDPIIKTCPECGLKQHPSVKICVMCEHEFIFKESLKAVSSSSDVVKIETQKWLKVTAITYSIHQKVGKTSSLRVNYKTGLTGFSEWVCYDHKGYAGHLARNWVNYRWLRKPKPANLAELLAGAPDRLMKPLEILVDTSGKFTKIKDYRFKNFR